MCIGLFMLLFSVSLGNGVRFFSVSMCVCALVFLCRQSPLFTYLICGVVPNDWSKSKRVRAHQRSKSSVTSIQFGEFKLSSKDDLIASLVALENSPRASGSPSPGKHGVCLCMHAIVSA
jgi:hypothetical protein